MNPVVTKRPRRRALSFSMAKAWLNLDAEDTTHDTLLRDLLEDVQESVESDLRYRRLIEQTITLWLHAGETSSPIYLPHVPVIAVDEIAVYDEDDVETVVQASNYRVTGLEPCAIVAANSGWTTHRHTDAMKITYRAGHVAAAQADGAGAGSQALSVRTNVFSPARSEGSAVRFVGSLAADAGENTTTTYVQDVTTASAVTLSDAATWDDGDYILIGDVPRDIMLEIKRRLAVHFEDRGDPVVGTLVTSPFKGDLLRRWKYGVH